MSWDTFTDAVLLVIFLSFFVERSLAVFFETRFCILKIFNYHIEPYIAVAFSMLLVFLSDINLLLIFQNAPETSFVWN